MTTLQVLGRTRKMMAIGGLALALVGMVALIYQGFMHSTRDMEAGPNVTALLLSGMALGAGVFLLLLGARLLLVAYVYPKHQVPVGSPAVRR